nr:hypothetical protein [Tanacetum cinerariifolium]
QVVERRFARFLLQQISEVAGRGVQLIGQVFHRRQPLLLQLPLLEIGRQHSRKPGHHAAREVGAVEKLALVEALRVLEHGRQVRQDDIAAVLVLVVAVLKLNLMVQLPEYLLFARGQVQGLVYFVVEEAVPFYFGVQGAPQQKPPARFHLAKANQVEIGRQRCFAKRAMQQLLAREQAQQRMRGRRIATVAVKRADAGEMLHTGEALGVHLLRPGVGGPPHKQAQRRVFGIDQLEDGRHGRQRLAVVFGLESGQGIQRRFDLVVGGDGGAMHGGGAAKIRFENVGLDQRDVNAKTFHFVVQRFAQALHGKLSGAVNAGARRAGDAQHAG